MGRRSGGEADGPGATNPQATRVVPLNSATWTCLVSAPRWRWRGCFAVPMPAYLAVRDEERLGRRRR